MYFWAWEGIGKALRRTYYRAGLSPKEREGCAARCRQPSLWETGSRVVCVECEIG